MHQWRLSCAGLSISSRKEGRIATHHFCRWACRSHPQTVRSRFIFSELLLCPFIPSTFSVVVVPTIFLSTFHILSSVWLSYIFFPRSTSVAFPSSLSRDSSISPIWPRNVPSSSSYFILYISIFPGCSVLG
jgi:hypothetical protein